MHARRKDTTTMRYYAKVDIDGRARVRQASERATSGIVA